MEVYLLLVFLQGKPIGLSQGTMNLHQCVTSGVEMLKMFKNDDFKVQCYDTKTREVVWDSSLQ